jgi:two-component system chemotaxis sensor kinase CheA
VLPLIRLRKLFDLADDGAVNGDGRMVVLRWGRMEAGVIVDQLIGSQEVVIKPLGPMIGGIGGLAGGSILGDGKIALILDVPELFRHATRQRDRVVREVS